MQRHDDDDNFDERGCLKDGHRFRVPVKMMDSYQRDVVQHFQKTGRPVFSPQVSTAFPRPHGCYVVDGAGGTAGLHRPGPRLAAGGNGGTRAMRDAKDEAERARDRYLYDLANAWKRRDAMPAEADAEREARAAAIRNAILSRGHDYEYVEAYLDSLGDDELLDGSISDHVEAFEKHLQAFENGRDARTLAADRKSRLDELYKERDAELSQQWRRR
jgi:hypothetical protein